VLKTMGVTGDSLIARHLPIIIAFAILAAYTYQSGLRAPALIAFVKDTLIYIVIIVAVIYLPYKLGGWGSIFDSASAKFAKTPAPGDGIILNANNQVQYITLALGSALALFLYPHSITGVLASKNRNVIKRNMSALPAYSFLLGLIALLGYMAISAGVKPLAGNKAGSVDSNTVVPLLFDNKFPSWFAGVAFAAIGIGALVPAAIMSIAAANLFTRNIYKEYFKPDATPKQEAFVAKLVSLFVKAGAVVVILALDPQFSIDLQLIGGVLILMTLPPIVFCLFTRWFHGHALLAGLIAGLVVGMMGLATAQTSGSGQGAGAASGQGGSTTGQAITGQRNSQGDGTTDTTGKGTGGKDDSYSMSTRKKGSGSSGQGGSGSSSQGTGSAGSGGSQGSGGSGSGGY